MSTIIRWHGATIRWRGATVTLWIASRIILLANILANIALWHHFGDAVFWHYGYNIVVLHKVPYRDFVVEYPPAAVVLFMLAGAATMRESFDLWFALVLLLVDLCTLCLIRALADQRFHYRGGWPAALLYTLLTFLTGAVATKFDLCPAVLSLAATALLARRHNGIAWASLAVAMLFKGYPIVLAPVFLMYQWNHQRDMQWWKGPLVLVGILCVVLVPIYFVAGRGFIASQIGQAHRGIELESTYASVVLLHHELTGSHISVTPGVETLSRDVYSPLSAPLAAAFPWVLTISLAVCYFVAWFRLKHDSSLDTLLLLGVAALVAFMISYYALPAHYLLWTIPLSAVLCGRPVRRPPLLTYAVVLPVILSFLGEITWTQLRTFTSPWNGLAIAIIVLRNASIVGLYAYALHAVWKSSHGITRETVRSRSSGP